MLCKIADLITEVPEAGDLVPRCKDYLFSGEIGADITIRADLYRYEEYPDDMSDQMVAYMESAFQFYMMLLRYDGFYLHSSAVMLENKAYLFSGPCGMGKSTHTRIWQQVFGKEAKVFNDDKPALRRIDGKWYAYGTPWCGKDSINLNMKVPLAGICFLKQAPDNRIRRLSVLEAVQKIIPQTIYRFSKAETMRLLLNNIEKLVNEIPVFELENRPVPEAARLSYDCMYRAAKELEL